jgi:predicted glycosyltransferase
LSRLQEPSAHEQSQLRGVKIWIDLENTPHIPFFQPIIKELNKRGHTVVLTARDAYQTCEMADLYGLQYQKIGHHYGKRMFLKAWGLGVRVIQLIPYLWSEKPALALNHGARAQTILCNLFRVPSVTIMDYEHTAESGKFNACWSIFPEVVANNRLDRESNDKLLSYAGIKEDVYAPELKPNPAILQQLRLLDAKIIITVRPPANEAHYHNHEADVLFSRFMDRAVGIAGVKVVLLPRNKRQEALIRAEYPRWFRDSNVIIPDTVVDGMNLLWHSDLVVSGGGTMNREAAALGVPVYSIFRGTIGAVDHYLQSQGRLTLIENVEDVDKKIIIAARSRGATVDSTPRKALFDIVNHIEFIINRECTRHQKNRTDE